MPSATEKEEESEITQTSGGQKRKRNATSSKSARTRAGKKSASKGKRKEQVVIPDSEEEALEMDDEDGSSSDDTRHVPLASRRSTRQRAVVPGGYREAEESDDDMPEDEPVESVTEALNPDSGSAITPPPEEEAPYAPPPGLDDAELITMDDAEPASQVAVKAEPVEPVLESNADDTDAAIDVDEEPGIVESSQSPPLMPVDALLDSEDEEEKPKPIMSLRYKGFSIHGRCLCVIVEPWPPIRQQREMSLQPMGLTGPRAPSIAPADFVPSTAARRERTPLFLPDPDERDRSITPAPTARRVLPPVPLWNDNPAEEEPDGGMLAFSQVLHSVGGYSTGAIEDEDEIDGSVFLGDADEARGYE